MRPPYAFVHTCEQPDDPLGHIEVGTTVEPDKGERRLKAARLKRGQEPSRATLVTRRSGKYNQRPKGTWARQYEKER